MFLVHFGRLNAKNLSFFYFVNILLFYCSKLFLSIIPILLSVAFFTLFERKILGYSHFRFGPNKLIYWGLFQPFSDALKLFIRVDSRFKEVNIFLYLFSPVIGLFLSLFLWVLYPFWGVLYYYDFSFVIFIIVRGLRVYFLLYRGWVTCTKFSLLGSYRSSAQRVSYEVVMIICFLVIVYWCCSICIFYFYFNFLVGFFFLSFPLFLCWLLSCVAECNRSPFDFSEGESELVSGFNTEYGGGLFSLIFVGEYSSILFLSLFTSLIFFSSFSFFLFFSFSFFYLWLRCSFPRLRYDLLMMIAWRSLLFIPLMYFFFTLF